MIRSSWLKPFVTVGMVAGLLGVTILTAMAGTEGGILGLTLAPQAAPSQQDADGSTSTEATAHPEGAPRAWVWHGLIVETDLEGGFLALHSDRCGKWALLPADEDVAEELKALVGEETPVLLVGNVSTEPNIMQQHTIEVLQVATDRSELPEDVRLFPRCQERPAPRPQPHQAPGAGVPGFTNILQRLGLAGYHQLPAGEKFSHFVDAEATYINADDDLVTAVLTAGIAVEATDDALTFDPNGPETDTTVSITDETKIIRPGQGNMGLIEEGDKVFVLQVNGETVAIIASDQVTVWPHAPNRSEATTARPQLRGQGADGETSTFNLNEGRGGFSQMDRLSVDRDDIQSLIEAYRNDFGSSLPFRGEAN